MKPLKIRDLEVKLPIIQGGMGVAVSTSSLAAAVANAGGIGVIASVGLVLLEEENPVGNVQARDTAALIKEIRTAKELSNNGAIGVNIMVALSDSQGHLRTCIDEKVDIVFMGAGLPLKIPLKEGETLANIHTIICPKISSARGAKVIFNGWEKKYNYVPDVVVIEGPKAGGHLGFKKEQIFDPAFSLENILKDVLEFVKPYEEKYNKKIPVIVGGGIFSGEDIHRVMELGASGVKMGTRFVATDECNVAQSFKQKYVDCKEDDIVIISSPVGLPGRVIRTPFVDAVNAGEKVPFTCPWKCIITCDYKKVPYCIAKALGSASRGDFDNGFAFCGSNAYKVKEIVPVKKLMETLVEEYNAATVKK